VFKTEVLLGWNSALNAEPRDQPVPSMALYSNPVRRWNWNLHRALL